MWYFTEHCTQEGEKTRALKAFLCFCCREIFWRPSLPHRKNKKSFLIRQQKTKLHRVEVVQTSLKSRGHGVWIRCCGSQILLTFDCKQPRSYHRQQTLLQTSTRMQLYSYFESTDWINGLLVMYSSFIFHTNLMYGKTQKASKQFCKLYLSLCFS